MRLRIPLVAALVLGCHSWEIPIGLSPCAPGQAIVHRRASCPIAASKPNRKSKSRGVDFSSTGSTDASGYRRGSFGIGKNESIVLWAVVGLALVFGGALDDETAQKIGAAQRDFYKIKPSPEVERIKAKSKTVREERVAAYLGKEDARSLSSDSVQPSKSFRLYD